MISKFARRIALGMLAVSVGNNIRIGLAFSTVGKKILTRRALKNFNSALSVLQFRDPNEPKSNLPIPDWEELFQREEEKREKIMQTPKAAPEPTIKPPIRVVTFDLDNTLWKTSETITAANDALAEYLSTKTDVNGNELKIPKRIEKVMLDVFLADRRKYCPLVKVPTDEEEESDEDKDTEESYFEWKSFDEEKKEKPLDPGLKSPVLLTQLRIDAICQVLETENDFSEESALSFAKDAFDVWTEARHNAILDHLAPQVVETLNDIRTSIKGDDDIPVLIGAVTDGNSDPRKIEILAPYFDFCVNAESVGVSKPDRRVFHEAIRQAITLRPNVFSPLIRNLLGADNVSVEIIDDITLEYVVGPYWCHIGDDFLKDVVAAKDMTMRTVFATELVIDKLLAKSSESVAKDPEMEMVEFLKMVSEEKVVKLGIGADEYLADQFQNEFINAVAQNFTDVSKILIKWHNEAVDPVESSLNITNQRSQKATDYNVLEVIEPEPPEAHPLTDIPTALPMKFKDENETIKPRQFRITRGAHSVSVMAPMQKRGEKTIEGILWMAQQDKSHRVFAFGKNDRASLKNGTKVPIVKFGDTDVTEMSVEQVLGFSDKNPLQLTLHLKDAIDKPSVEKRELNTIQPRAFRIIREDCSVNVMAPMQNRGGSLMKSVMQKAQQDKSHGVFAFDPDDIASLKDGKKVLMIKVGDTDLDFSREIFSDMTVEDVLALSSKNPLELSLCMKEAIDKPSFDLF